MQDRHVFPVQICVTKLSGMGDDAVFLGLLRPIAFSKRDVRAWIAPNGTLLCCDNLFSSLTGIPGVASKRLFDCQLSLLNR